MSSVVPVSSTIARYVILALLAFAMPMRAQEPRCNFSRVPGVVWWGTQSRLPVSSLAAYMAPILWLSPDEPALQGASGVDIRIPEAFPGEAVPDRPVVYYQLDRVLSRPTAKGPAVARSADGPGHSALELGNVAVLTLSYFAHFATEEGLGAHPHDIEPTEFRAAVALHTWPGFEKWIPGGAKCSKPTFIIIVTRVSAKAHGLVWYWNILEPDISTILPMHILVEEGKHGMATDKNGDGVFTKGYDVNRRINDAWGTRDIISQGMLFSGGYESWMAKTRRPEHRIFPPLPDDSPLQPELRRRMTGGRFAVYELRPIPPSSIAGDDAILKHKMAEREVVDWPVEAGLRDMEAFSEAVGEGAVLKSISVAFRADRAGAGVSWVFPFFVVKHLEDPMAGGYVMQRMYLTDDRFRDFGWMALYTPSASRWMDTYLAAGGERDGFTDSLGVEHKDWDFVFETGLKLRVNLKYTPLKFLTFFTEYWGLRAGIKNRGFFDIDALSYVLEFGAGSF